MRADLWRSGITENSGKTETAGGAKRLVTITEKDAGNREMAKDGNFKTETVRAADPLQAAKTKAGELKAAAARDFRILKRVRLAAVLAIDLSIIMAAVLDRIVETKLPENEAGRAKALAWIHRQLRQKRDRRTKKGA